MRVIIQAGHSWEFPPYMTLGGGAPGEAEWTAQVARVLAAKLNAAGVQTDIVGAWGRSEGGVFVVKTPPAAMRKAADLFVSLHYDAAIYGASRNTGCIIARAWNEQRPNEADRAIREWLNVYPAGSGIPLRQERVNPNMTDYYGFKATTVTTPGILVECGVGQGLDKGTLSNIELIAELNAQAILNYLGVETVTEEDQQIVAAVRGAGGSGPQSIEEWHRIIGEWRRIEPLLREEIGSLKSDKAALEQTEAELRNSLASASRELRSRPEVRQIVLREEDTERVFNVSEVSS